MRKRKIELLVLTTIFVAIAYLSIREFIMVSDGKNPFIFELMAAILGSIITVTAMAIMLRMQTSEEMEREYSTRLFEQKLTMYQDVLGAVIEADDDNVNDHDEVQTIENKIGRACLVAHHSLVSIFSQFMYQLKAYGVIYYRSLTPDQLAHFSEFVLEEKRKPYDHSTLAFDSYHLKKPVKGNEADYFISLDDFIQGMRKDLSVVEGNVQGQVENFSLMKYNEFGLIPD